MRRPRVALLSPYWGFWESNVAFDLRADRRALAAEVAAQLDDVDVVADVTVDGPEAAAGAAEAIRSSRPDALLVVQSMAVAPATTMAVLDRVPDLPLAVLAALRRAALPDVFDHSDITTEGATVGVPQLTNVLHRTGRRHALVVARLGDPSFGPRVSGAVTAAAAAGRLRAARIGRVGRPIPGYLCVDVEQEELLAATGSTLVPIEASVVREAYLGVGADSVAAVEWEVRAGWALDSDVEEDECLLRSLRLAAALEVLDDQLALDAGAMNCHVPEIRFADDPGVTPCFALGRETSRGIPWACSGDVLTTVAMLATKLLGGAALYHEIEALDMSTGEALLANSGEHDVAWADPGAALRLRRNGWFASDPRCGACACFAPPPGPATLVGFTPHPDAPGGFRFVVAEGELTSRAFPHTGTANGAFRFAGAAPVEETWARWAGAGVNHHSSATPGHLGEAVEAVALHLGIGCLRIS